MTKIVFLDIDGVLNSASWFEECFLARGRRGAENMDEHEQLDPKAIACLNDITDATGAQIVLSSTWRLVRDFPGQVEKLTNQGIRAPIIGRTPRLYRPNLRGSEIAAWLMTQLHWPDGIVILDDDTDMEHLLPWLVHTDPDLGLIPSNVKQAVAMLNNPGWNSDSRPAMTRTPFGES